MLPISEIFKGANSNSRGPEMLNMVVAAACTGSKQSAEQAKFALSHSSWNPKSYVMISMLSFFFRKVLDQ